MKKTLTIMIAMVMVLVCVSTTAFAVSNKSISSSDVGQTVTEQESESVIRYFPFVYSDADDYAWFRENIIQSSDCEVGYLYVKDLTTGEIWKVLDFQVDYIRENTEKIYYVFNGNELGVTDYAGTTFKTVYSSEDPITFVELYDEIVYLVTGSDVVRIDPQTDLVEATTVSDEINFFLPVEENAFLWSSDEDVYLVENGDVSQQCLLDEEVLSHQYLSTEITDSEEMSDVSPYAVTVSQPSLPLSEYPSGSYFTYNGEACTNHGTGTCSYTGGCNCKYYDNSIQCMGFAKYASDQYAHRSSWSLPSGDSSTTRVTLSTDSEVLVYFSSLPKGSYLRLANSSGVEVHSVVTIYVSNSTVQTYECNYSGACQVSVESRSLSSFRSSYRYVTESLTHHFDDYTYINATYHRADCSSSGCTGYIYESHYSDSSSSGSCAACGASGNISIIQ